MATKNRPVKTEPQEEARVQRKMAVELERGSVSVSRDGLTFSISGKNVKLQKQSPLSLTFDSGEVELSRIAINQSSNTRLTRSRSSLPFFLPETSSKKSLIAILEP